MFVEAGTGRPLRYPETQANESGGTVQNGTEAPVLTPEGHGAIAEYEFVGTGFHVGNGFVVTNRHVIQPWQADPRAQTLSSSVKGQPRLRKLTAFFPGSTQPIALRFKQAGQREDVAVCPIEATELPPEVPVRPLEKDCNSAPTRKPWET